MLELSHDELSAGILPEAGGAMVWLTARGVDVLRRGDPAAVAVDPTAAACFPLVPYSGPVAGGRFSFAGIEHRLALNHPNEPEPVHGEGWIARWEPVQHGAAEATLRYRHTPGPGTIPFAYLAEQHIALDSGGVTIGMSVTNTGEVPMPAGIGVHPYFPHRSGLRLELPATGIWARRPLEIAESPIDPVPEAWRFAPAGPAAALIVEDCFVGWGGKAGLSWPDRGVTVQLSADPVFRFVQLYATADDDFLCVEPVSNANDGFNLLAAGVAGHGVEILAPKKRLAGAVRLGVLQAG
ncbi:MAG: aldose 1-epimerase [Geminicoccaceae bacterium]